MDQDVVINHNTAAIYGDRQRGTDGKVRHVYHVPIENHSQGHRSPPHEPLSEVLNTVPQQRPSNLVSQVFDTVVVDPKDLSILRPFLGDLESKLSRPTKCLEAWERWQPLLNTIWIQPDRGPADELRRIKYELDLLLEESGKRKRAQEWVVRVFITAAYRYAVVTASQVRDSHLQPGSLTRLQLLRRTDDITECATQWTSDVLASVLLNPKACVKLMNSMLDDYLVDTALSRELRKKLIDWTYGLYNQVRLFSQQMAQDINSAYTVFEKEVLRETSDIDPRLPTLSTAYTRSVGVMLDAGVHVSFGGMVSSFKNMFMDVIEVCPSKAHDDPQAFIESWSIVHDALLRVLMLKPDFHIGVPSPEEVLIVAHSFKQVQPVMDPIEPLVESHTDVGDSHLNLQGCKTLSVTRGDGVSSLTSPAAAVQAAQNIPESGVPLPEPGLSSRGKGRMSKPKWLKRSVARLRRIFRKI